MQDIQKLETDTRIKLLKMGSKLQKVFPMKDQLKVVVGGARRRPQASPKDGGSQDA